MSATDSPLLGWGTPRHNEYLEPLNKHSNAYAASILVKSGPGILYGFTVYNSGAVQFVLIFDAAALPADGTVPALVLAAGATSNIGANWIPGRTFQTGIVICNSSTGPTKTIGSADCYFDAQYL